MKTVFAVLCLTGCSSTVVVRGSSSDYLQKKGTTVTVNAPPTAVKSELERLFPEKGFTRGDTVGGDSGSEVIYYKGPRYASRQAQDYGVQLGSWFAVRLLPITNGTQTTVSIIGKPMVGQIEVCSDADGDLRDVKYVCTDTQVPKNWMGLSYVSGRDEETVVSGVLDKLYERLK